MANLSAATVCAAVGEGEDYTGPAAEVIAAGQYVRLNTSTGKWELGNSSSAGEAWPGGIALNAATVAGLSVTVRRRGLVDLGNIFTGAAFDADIFIGSSDGLLADSTAGTNHVVGTVVPGFGATSADKLLRVVQ